MTIDEIFENEKYNTLTFIKDFYDENFNDRFSSYIVNSENFSFTCRSMPRLLVIELAHIFYTCEIPFLIDTFVEEDNIDGAYYVVGDEIRETNNNLIYIRETLFRNKIPNIDQINKYKLMMTI